MERKAIDLKKNHFFNDCYIVSFSDLAEDQIALVLEMRNDERVRPWLVTDHVIQRDEHEKFLSNLREDQKNCYFMVYRNDRCMGVVSLNRIDYKNRHSYLGLYANPFLDEAGKGRHLISCLKFLCFEVADLHSLRLEVIESNHRALNLYSQTGFTKEGVLKDYILKKGRWFDMIIMGIVNK